jgi:hypothetical protein
MVALNEKQIAFLEKNHGAAMVSLRRDGSPQVVRVGIMPIDGRIWSSGTSNRLRTRLLRRDPRCTLMVFDATWGYLTLEGRVTILAGPDVPDLSIRLFQAMQAGLPTPPPAGHLVWQGQVMTLDAFRQTMIDDHRIIYEFGIERAYGLVS